VCQAGFDPWLTTLLPQRPELSKPQAPVWALGSFGMVLARSCALPAVRHVRARGMPRQEQTVRQPRRAWADEVPRTRGATRHARPVETCWAPWLGWVVRWGPGTPWALALAAPPLGPRGVVLALRGVDRGGAIPVAWGILPAGATPAWRREWRRRWRRRPRAIPRDGTGSVVAERGVDAPWRLRRLPRLGWQPCVRINPGGRVRPAGGPCWCPGLRVVPRPGTRGRGTGLALPRHPGPCPRRARWDEGDKAPGRRLTARAPAARDAGW
jgi:hypothetical protein